MKTILQAYHQPKKEEFVFVVFILNETFHDVTPPPKEAKIIKQYGGGELPCELVVLAGNSILI